MEYPVIFLELIESFKRLNGVGAKSAERMAYDVLNMKKQDIEKFANAILAVNNLSSCPRCGSLSNDGKLCEICADETRDQQTICVVSHSKDVFAFEKMKEYQGVYHVLNGYISPSKGINYDDINLSSLIERIKNDKINEVILATDLTMEGEITAMYIAKLLEKYKDVNVTRLAHGLPNGIKLDYADEMTLFKAFTNRKKMNS